MKQPLFRLTIICAALVGSFWLARVAQAAVIYPQPQELSVTVNETFIVSITLNSGGEVVNALEAELSYPVDMLKAVSVSNGGSFLTLWPVEPVVDEAKGIISFTGGVPGGSYVFDAQAVRITFQALKNGIADLQFNSSNTQALLNDGLGTPAPLSLTAGQVIINHPSPIDVVINSPTHPDQDKWYQNNDLIITWEPREESFYSYRLSSDPNYEPDKLPEVDIGTVEFPDLGDGIHYFILSEKLVREDWGLAGKRRAKIDQTPPLPFEAIASQEDNEFARQAVISFATTDAMSGIDRYDVLEGDVLYRDVTSPYILIDQSRSKAVTITAYDLAGNSRSAALPALSSTATDSSLGLLFWILVILAAILLVAYLLLRPILSDQTKNN